MEKISVPVSPGELLDKITILEIKVQQIADTEKLRNVKTELELLNQAWEKTHVDDSSIKLLKQSLRAVNQDLWSIEDRIRIKESQKNFDEGFIELARSVYLRNDRRAAIKKEINTLLGSVIVEEKSYASYQSPVD